MEQWSNEGCPVPSAKESQRTSNYCRELRHIKVQMIHSRRRGLILHRRQVSIAPIKWTKFPSQAFNRGLYQFNLETLVNLRCHYSEWEVTSPTGVSSRLSGNDWRKKVDDILVHRQSLTLNGNPFQSEYFPFQSWFLIDYILHADIVSNSGLRLFLLFTTMYLDGAFGTR